MLPVSHYHILVVQVRALSRSALNSQGIMVLWYYKPVAYNSISKTGSEAGLVVYDLAPRNIRFFRKFDLHTLWFKSHRLVVHVNGV